MNNISKHILYKEVTEAIEHNPLAFQPLMFLKSFDFDSTVSWITKAVDDYDKLSWTYNCNDIQNKCLVIKIWRETKQFNKSFFGSATASYFECLKHCVHEYPGSFIIFRDACNDW